MNPDVPLKAAVFLDTRPGHRKQTLGVLEALKALTGLATLQVELPHLSRQAETMQWLNYFFGGKKTCCADLAGCDFIIGTGSRSHIPMLFCKKKYNIPVITCMAPADMLRRRIDLCFVPRHDNIPEAENIFLTDGPPNMSRNRNQHDPDMGLILIGGKDDKSHRWEDKAILDAVDFLVRERAVRWTISSSPRTPDETNSSLAKLVEKFDNAYFIKFADTGTGWIEEQYDKNKTVWVTADSISMLFEARSAGCRVGVIPVQWNRQNNKFQRCIDGLSERGQIVPFAAWRAGKANWNDAEPLNEALRCAREILKRWWPNRLQ